MLRTVLPAASCCSTNKERTCPNAFYINTLLQISYPSLDYGENLSHHVAGHYEQSSFHTYCGEFTNDCQMVNIYV